MNRLEAMVFEEEARRVLSDHYGMELAPGSVPHVHKRFDLVAAHRRIIGDAKYYTLVGGLGRPSAKLATISEYVWLLEKTGAPTTFLIFGNDRAVPMMWLKDYGNLTRRVTFYFLTQAGDLELLAGPNAH